MANKSLTDLTARTATADSDLLHINSGGTDYKEQKSDFLQGSFNVQFNNTSLLTSQIDALPSSISVCFGTISANGHQTETGVPISGNGMVICRRYSTANVELEFHVLGGQERSYQIKKVNGAWEPSWIQMPTRAEITSLNNSLTNSCKVVYVSDKVGAQSAGAHGYVGVSYTVPTGFKTSGIYSLSVGHPGQASSAGFSVIGSVARGVTGTNTAYVSYTVPYGNLPDSGSDFALYIHCVPSSWDV